MEKRVKSQFAQVRTMSYYVDKFKYVSFPITPKLSYVCEMHCIDLSSAEGNWPSQLFTSWCLSLPAIPCPLWGIWGTIQLLESLFETTNVFWLLNINSWYRCDWNNKAVHLRDWFYWSSDFQHADNLYQIHESTCIWQPLVIKGL
jgi:hypothetical protein